MLWFCMVLCRGSTPLRHLHTFVTSDMLLTLPVLAGVANSRTPLHGQFQNLHLSRSQHCDASIQHLYNKASAATCTRREMYEYDSTRSKNFPRDCTSVKYIWCRCRTRYTALWCRSGCRVPSRQHREHAHVCSVTGVTQDSGRTPATPACLPFCTPLARVPSQLE